MEPNTKNCPFCGELIKSDAQKCLKDIHEGKSVDPAAVVEQIVDEVKTDIPAKISDAQQKTIPISDIVPEKVVSETKTYPSGTIILFDGNKVTSKLKNFYKNRFLPFYQNSHLLFLFLLLIYNTLFATLKLAVDTLFIGRIGRYGGISALAAYSLLHGKFVYAYMAVAAITLAAAMLFITVRDDEEKLRSIMHSLLLPIVLFTFLTAGYCHFFTPDHILQDVHKFGIEDSFNTLVPLKTICFILSAASSVLIALLLARGQFFRLFFIRILTLCVAGVIYAGGIIPADYDLYYYPIYRLRVLFFHGIPADYDLYYYSIIDSLISLILLLVFCRKIIFKNSRIEFDWWLIGKFFWCTLCLFAVSYFYSIFLNTARIWTAAWEKIFIATPILSWLCVCIWSGKVNGVQNKLGFYLKTLLGCMVAIFGLSYLYFNVIYKYNTPTGDSFVEWTAMKTWVMVIAGIITVKTVSAAYYCSIKWYFMLPVNMFLLLMGCVPVLNFVFPGNNPLGVVIFNRMGLPTEYGWIFLTISFIIDIFALFHVIYTRKKPFELNKHLHVTCAVLAVLMMLYGFFAVKSITTESELTDIYTESELTDIYKEMPLLISQDGKMLIKTQYKDVEQAIIPDGVTTIKGWAFARCSKLHSITIPDSVKTIEGYAFYNCDKLTEVIIPDGVTEIGEWAFAYCNNLSRVVIPESVTKIEATAFQYCFELKTIEIPKNCIYEPEDPFIQIIRRSK